MQNSNIKNYAQKKRVKLWEIAEVLKISDANFSRKLRKQLSAEETQKILEIIDVISKKYTTQEEIAEVNDGKY